MSKPWTKEQKKILRRYWKAMRILEQDFYTQLFKLEVLMAKDTGIKDIEFFSSDGGIVGIGNCSRSMELWQPRR